jgi:hypothetical protein
MNLRFACTRNQLRAAGVLTHAQGRTCTTVYNSLRAFTQSSPAFVARTNIQTGSHQSQKRHTVHDPGLHAPRDHPGTELPPRPDLLVIGPLLDCTLIRIPFLSEQRLQTW